MGDDAVGVLVGDASAAVELVTAMELLLGKSNVVVGLLKGRSDAVELLVGESDAAVGLERGESDAM